ncbi:cytosolic sulfotransferase 3-like [Pundamilia nyererei]|uniref:Sulfotransferase n=1 Tax=Pundamilia nyererei TaxID=303518 RepID=A0A9Y6JI37_9CICH|nr:PREDICTED: cytosolic sulfotransferase 3-like [Pundamilia nyererei]
MEVPLRPEMFDFHGVSMTNVITDNWDNVQDFKARPDDILISTYPKAGTDVGKTWQTSLIANDSFLSLPYSGTDLADKLPTTPRLIKTHLPVQFVPKSFWEQRCRVVYMARNAKDNVVSYFHFNRMNSALPEPGDWSTFLQDFMEGKRVYGSWYDHVNGWWEKKQTYSDFHYMFYEDLIEDYEKEIDRLCSFLGLSPSAEEKERIKASVTFDSMKQNKMTNYTTARKLNHEVSPFMRKGKVGDWKNHFTVAQNEQFDEDYKKKMKNPDLKFRCEIQRAG